MKKYKNVGEWKLDNPGEYNKAKNRGWLNEIASLNGWKVQKTKKGSKPNGYWDVKERCIEEARKYKTRTSWGNSSVSSIKSARVNGWFDECVAHMLPPKNKPKGYWNDKEKCITEAKKYKTRAEWARGSDGTYRAARKNKWVTECTSHMIQLQKPDGYWTKERCTKVALKYKTRNEWREGHRPSYQAAITSGFLDECNKHMEYTRHPPGYWTKERCIENAKKYTERFKWQRASNSSYGSAFKNGWVEECAAHMIEVLKPSGYWNIKKNCIEDAKKYKARTEWYKNEHGAVQGAKRNGWYEECTKHMK